MFKVPDNLPYKPQNVPKEETVPFEGADFKTTFWPVPEGTQIKGRVLIVHGFSEYAMVYTRLLDQLSRDGYESFFFDQRGAGLTSPGKLKGITNEYHTFKDLEFFIEKNLEEIKDRENNKLFLIGHSMGGGISLNYGVHGAHKDKLRGILVTGPLISLHPSTSPSRFVFKALSQIKKLLPNFRFDSALDPKYNTTDPGWTSYLQQDKVVAPLLGSLTQMYDFLTRGEKLKEPDYIKNFTPPVYILHGKKDEINDPAASQIVYDLIPGQDKKLTIIDNALHSLFLESDDLYSIVYKNTVEWLDQH